MGRHPPPSRPIPIPKPIFLFFLPVLLLPVLLLLYTHPLPTPLPSIYLYPVPTRFTTDIVTTYHRTRSSPSTTYPGHQHSAEFHLLSSLLSSTPPLPLSSSPSSAALFFVPFFSSLSLVANPTESDEKMQLDFVEWLEAQEYWRRSGGRDHVIVCQDPNALGKVIGRVSKAVLVVSDFGRVGGDRAGFVKDVVVPYSHRINVFKGEVGVEGRRSLLFFMGNRFRKEGGKIRDTLFQILEDEEDVVMKHGAQSRESRRMATQGMHSSKFCLHPAGDTPSACRLFDAIVSLCVPVVISDFIELPFEDVIDYKKIAIFVDTETAIMPGYLTRMLREISNERIVEYQRELKAVRHYFDYDDPNGAVKEIWRQVSLKIPLIKLMINRDKRLVERRAEGRDCSCLCSERNGTTFFS